LTLYLERYFTTPLPQTTNGVGRLKETLDLEGFSSCNTTLGNPILKKGKTDPINRKLDPSQEEKVRKLQDIESLPAAQNQQRPRRNFPLRGITAVQEDISGLKTAKDVSTDYLKKIGEEAIRDMEEELPKREYI
jgi:hypothetical protein